MDDMSAFDLPDTSMIDNMQIKQKTINQGKSTIMGESEMRDFENLDMSIGPSQTDQSQMRQPTLYYDKELG